MGVIGWLLLALAMAHVLAWYLVGIWVESPLSLAWIGLARLSKPALLAEHVATVSS